MTDLVGEQKTMAVRIYPAVGAGVVLGLAQLFDVLCRETPARAHLPGSASFDSGASFIRIIATPFNRLAICLFAVVLAVLAFVFSMAKFAKASFAIMFRCVIKEGRERLVLLTLPTSFLPRFNELPSGLAVFLSIGVSGSLAANLAPRGIPALVSRMFVELGERLDRFTTSTLLHLTSASESALFDRAGGVRMEPAFRDVSLALPSL